MIVEPNGNRSRGHRPGESAQNRARRGSQERPAGGAVRVGEILDDVLDEAGLRQQISRVKVLSDWNDVVGDRIARVTRPRSVSGSALIVEVRSSSWLTELNLLRHEILRRLNAGREEGRIDRLVLVLAQNPDGVNEPASARGGARDRTVQKRKKRMSDEGADD